MLFFLKEYSYNYLSQLYLRVHIFLLTCMNRTQHFLQGSVKEDRICCQYYICSFENK